MRSARCAIRNDFSGNPSFRERWTQEVPCEEILFRNKWTPSHESVLPNLDFFLRPLLAVLSISQSCVLGRKSPELMQGRL
jgi:hypothetical protein